MNTLNDILFNLRNKFIIIGLTGAVGSGCSEVANFLSENNVEYKKILNCMMKNINQLNNIDELEKYRIKRIMWFYNEYNWKGFHIIKTSDILFSILLEVLVEENISVKDNKNIDEIKIIDFLEKNIEFTINNKKINLKNILKNLENFKELEKYFLKDLLISEEIKNYEKEKNYKISKKLANIHKFIKNFVNKNQLYLELFQVLGKEIREKGQISNYKSLYSIFNISNKNDEYDFVPPIFIIPEIIRRIISLYRKEFKNQNQHQFFIIDALRNVYEIEFFKNRYTSFYLFSILASEEIRKQRIFNNFKLSPEEYEKIKKFENKKENHSDQNINACIGKGDIFINNDFNSPYRNKLYYQLLKYISIIRYPALFTPTKDERFMQVALTARYNSGCISRQVGAVVVGEDGYIRGFGWNDVPENHIPCVYRTINDLLSCEDKLMFSKYERSKEFINYIKENIEEFKIIENYPFCFKDIQNKKESKEKFIKLEKELKGKLEDKYWNELKEKFICKNPTRERALHAEENAFLQISKVGGLTVKNGTLYTTDSPCQLCAKKVMQLKIKRVVYIDAYPDISITHTLQSGLKNEIPKFEMFSGAVREAYFKLYSPILGRKDEIKIIKKEYDNKNSKK